MADFAPAGAAVSAVENTKSKLCSEKVRQKRMLAAAVAKEKRRQ